MSGTQGPLANLYDLDHPKGDFSIQLLKHSCFVHLCIYINNDIVAVVGHIGSTYAKAQVSSRKLHDQGIFS